ncbi:MAG: phosphate ABC transporter substrate-binding protein [Clostridiales bacterium]|nr:phosphate ABC transporter substrate-binding protein [Clostridiales bacterium]
MKNNFKKFLTLGLAGIMAVGLTACGGNESSSSKTSSGSSSNNTSSTSSEDNASSTDKLSGKLTINGSTSMEKVVKALNEAFIAKNSDVSIDLIASGSGTGIKQAQEGRADIGTSSRKLKDSETGLTATNIAVDGVAIIANKEVGVEDITLEQLGQIYNGEIKNWKDLGGADSNIVVIGREEGSGTRGAFEDIVTGGEAAKAYAQTLDSTGAVINAVSTTPGAIGYASLANVDDTVLSLKIDGVEATDETIKDGSFKVQRPFVFAIKEGNDSELIQAYVDFVLSDEGQEIVQAQGLTKVK